MKFHKHYIGVILLELHCCLVHWIVFFYLVSFGGYSVLSLVSYLLLTLTVGCLIFSQYVVVKARWKKEEPHNPFADRLKDNKFFITQETVF